MVFLALLVYLFVEVLRSKAMQFMPEPHCLVALMESVLYSVASLIARFWHARLWVCYLAMSLMQLLAAAMLAGLFSGG